MLRFQESVKVQNSVVSAKSIWALSQSIVAELDPLKPSKNSQINPPQAAQKTKLIRCKGGGKEEVSGAGPKVIITIIIMLYNTVLIGYQDKKDDSSW